MDILSIVQAFFRRWYLTLPIVFLGLGGAAYLNNQVPPVLEARGQVLLADPELNPAGLPRNVVDVEQFAARLDSGQDGLRLLSEDVELRVDAQGQTLILDLAGPDEEAIRDSLSRVLSRYEEDIGEAQDQVGIPSNEQLRVDRPRNLEMQVDETEDGSFTTSLAVELQDPTANTSNPYGASGATGRILVVRTGGDEIAAEFADRTGGAVDFGVSQARGAGNILNVTTIGADPAAVLAAFDDVTDILRRELESRQERADVPTIRRTEIEILAGPERVVDVSPPLDRSVAAVVGLAGLLAVMVAVVVESVSTRRQHGYIDPGADELTERELFSSSDQKVLPGWAESRTAEETSRARARLDNGGRW